MYFSFKVNINIHFNIVWIYLGNELFITISSQKDVGMPDDHWFSMNIDISS